MRVELKAMAIYMFEVYYLTPVNSEKEANISKCVSSFGGWLDYREEPNSTQSAVCLTYEFNNLKQAELSASELRGQGEYIEGPYLYRD